MDREVAWFGTSAVRHGRRCVALMILVAALLLAALGCDSTRPLATSPVPSAVALAEGAPSQTPFRVTASMDTSGVRVHLQKLRFDLFRIEWTSQLMVDLDRQPGTGYAHEFELVGRLEEIDAQGRFPIRDAVEVALGDSGSGGWGAVVGTGQMSSATQGFELDIPWSSVREDRDGMKLRLEIYFLDEQGRSTGVTVPVEVEIGSNDAVPYAAVIP